MAEFESFEVPVLEELRIACNNLAIAKGSIKAAEAVIEAAFTEKEIPEVHIIQLDAID